MDSVSETKSLARIVEKLQRLRYADQSRRLFGASSHEYRLGSPLTEAKLQEKESEYGISLPSQYRKFLMKIGHGGAGPCYGIFSLDSKDPEFINRYGGDLAKPFSWTSRFNPDAWERSATGDLEGVEWDEHGRYV